jgi:hypothetical protein
MKQIQHMEANCCLCDEELQSDGVSDGRCNCICEKTAVYPLSPFALAMYYSLAIEAG